MGTRTSKVVPCPTVLRTEILPPSFCTTAWQTVSPMPVPMPTGLVVKNGSKMRSCASSGMPQPVSETLSIDSLPSVPVSTRISFSRGSLSPRACIALTRRFITTWWSFPRGALDTGAGRRSFTTRARLASSRSVRSRVEAAMSARSTGSSTWFSSARLKVLSSWTMVRTRWPPSLVSPRRASMSSSVCWNPMRSSRAPARPGESAVRGDDLLHVVHVALERGEVAEDEGQGVVDLVGHAGGDLADGGQLLALGELGRHPPVPLGVGEADEVADPGHQGPPLDGLVQVLVGAGLEALQLAVGVVELGGEEHHRHAGTGRVLSDATADLEPVHVRHADVEEDQVHAALLHLLQGLGAAVRAEHAEPFGLQVGLDEPHVGWLVVDHQDLRRRWSRCGPSS